jgi:FdrA protein
VLAFLGLSEHAQPTGAVRYADTLEAAALHAAALVGRPLPTPSPAAVRVGEARFIRGLFSGGTLCGEAMRLVADRVSTVMSNIPLKPDWHLTDIHASERHTFIDFGDDELTEGRPHPMIDPAQRVERIEQEAGDPDVGVILLDLVLGYGAHPDPAGAFAPVIARAREQRPDLAVIAALCGSERDPQGVVAQRARLEAAGAIVTRSVAQAARAALRSIGAEESGR